MQTNIMQKGFLSIDLLVGLAIFAVLVGISIPSLAYLVRHLELKKATQKITSSLETTSNKTLQSNITHTFHLASESYYITKDSKPEQLTKVQALPKSIKLLFAAQNNQIHFYPHGVCSPASFILTNGGGKCSFTVSLRCRISSKCES